MAALLVWDPQVRDLAAQAFRAELFEREGLAIWNNSWYAGHYTLTYSVLFPPLAALLSPQLVGALSSVAATALFDRLARARWGEPALWASLWFAVGAAGMVANGNLAFALGVAVGLAALGGLAARRTGLATVAAVACGLASPVAAVFLALVAAAGFGLGERDRLRPAVITAGAAIAPVLILNLLFPEPAEQPFSAESLLAPLVWGAGALLLAARLPRERPLLLCLGAYLVVALAVFLVPNALGDNVLRLAAVFGGPVLLAALLGSRARLEPALAAVAVALLGWAAYWQLADPVDEVVDAAGDPSTEASYYEPLAAWLRAREAATSRIEVPPTENTWEAAHLAPELNLARGWLRQADVARNELFFEDSLDPRAYRDWLRELGVRYVAVAKVPAHKYAAAERELVLSEPPYLEPAGSPGAWRVWRVRGAGSLVESEGTARARLTSLEPQAFELEVTRPGSFLVRVREAPYWSLVQGEGCLGERDGWMLVRADDAGTLRAEIEFSLDGGWRAITGSRDQC